MERWCASRRLERGAVVPLAQCFELGKLWYRGRLNPEWRRGSVESMQATFAAVGLTDAFWKIQ